MNVLLTSFSRSALARVAASLLVGALVASCATATDAPSPQARSASVATDANIERVVLQAYRAISDRHLYEPNFRTLSAETYRGFASTDPALSLETSESSFTVRRDGREVISRPTPADTSDGRAWGGMLAELLAGSIDSSPSLQESARQALIRTARLGIENMLDALGDNLHVSRLVALRAWAADLDLSEAQLTFTVLEGPDPAQAILDHAAQIGADHILMGARGHSTARRYLGSVSSKVVAEAAASVTVIRLPGTPPEA